MALVTNSLADLAQSRKGPRFAMYEMWLSQIPGVVAAPELQDVQLRLEQTETPELPGAQEYRERILALENELAALRREQSSIQRSFFEAAQIQRRLCAPRQ